MTARRYSPYRSEVGLQGSVVGYPRYSGYTGLAGSVGYQNNRLQGSAYSEYIPIEKSYTDYVPEYKVDYRPVERRYTDYQEIRHEIDYVPVPRVEYDYYPEERSYYVGETNNLPLERSRGYYGPGYGYNSGYGVGYGSGYAYGSTAGYPARGRTSVVGYGPARSGYYGSSYASPYKYL